MATVISSDLSHTQENPVVPSPTETHNLTGNNPSYEDMRATPDDARRLIEKAILYLNEHGTEKAFAAFNDPTGEFCYKDAYIFAIDMNGIILAHGGDIELVGTNQYYLKDSVGIYFIQEFIKLITEQDEGWIKYRWHNYETFEIESKLTLLKRYDSLIFLGCGIYCCD
jgi:hypothetical protein